MSLNARSAEKVQLLLGRLEHVREAALTQEDRQRGIVARWMARCPGHDDHDPSLGIALTADGRVLIHCFAGCPADRVLASAGLNWRDLAPDASGDGAASKAPPVLLHQVDYEVRDASGRLIAVHRRRDYSDGSKRLSWLTPGPDGRLRPGLGGLSPADLPLYGVDRLDPSYPGVVVVEGEKAAEALGTIVRNAVGTVTGASSTPGDEALRALLGFERIYLWPDNDGPGRDHMLRVGDRLRRLGAKDVRVLEWCDAPEHGDAADFVEHYGDRAREKLRELVAVAQPFETWAQDVQAKQAAGPETTATPPQPAETWPGADLPDVGAQLPAWLSEILASLRTQAERDAFLAAALGVLSGALPNVQLLYGGRWHTPALYTLAIGTAGAGKGAAVHARRLVDLIDERLRQETRHALEVWERAAAIAREQKAEPPPRPPERFLIVAESASELAITRRLEENPDGLVLFSSEADALSTVLGQDWGRWSHLLRKAFHHEAVRRETKAEGLLVVERPVLAVALTGTPAQLWRLMEGGVEDGLFSRFLITRLRGDNRWVSQRPTARDRRLQEAVETGQREVYARWETLRGRERPLTFELTDEQWDRLDATFEAIFDQVVQHVEAGTAPDALAAVVKRAALAAVRIACILTILHREPDVLERAAVLEADARAFEAALMLAVAFCRASLSIASRALARKLEAEMRADPKLQVLAAMPEVFSTAEWVARATEVKGVTRRAAEMWLRELLESGAIQREARGTYRKMTGFGYFGFFGNFGNGTPQTEETEETEETEIRTSEERKCADDDGWFDPFEDEPEPAIDVKPTLLPEPVAPHNGNSAPPDGDLETLRACVLALAEAADYPALWLPGFGATHGLPKMWQAAVERLGPEQLKEALEMLENLQRDGAPF
ncbi:DUF3987 domain-containing protein [Rhodothermus marinus]|uniref:Toprim domain-containing protein n=1 Tax=Rhodothermus marinus (strain ATCC 43812 / DSM 4252 / R-10) TaxID=518766 RepID=D0MK56_RHOM4|nr:DUF3987 domain-containing protein [Rhodothermus marinus]ACY46969.1 hypothetical protein Rmar_0060 [Rhodothermus marinus DSM 4252]